MHLHYLAVKPSVWRVVLPAADLRIARIVHCMKFIFPLPKLLLVELGARQDSSLESLEVVPPSGDVVGPQQARPLLTFHILFR